jgi:hypothetical protein
MNFLQHWDQSKERTGRSRHRCKEISHRVGGKDSHGANQAIQADQRHLGPML